MTRRVALQASVFDLGDKVGERDRMHLIAVVVRPLWIELILDVDSGNPGGGELAHRAHRMQGLAKPGAGVGDERHPDRPRHLAGDPHLLVHRQ